RFRLALRPLRAAQAPDGARLRPGGRLEAADGPGDPLADRPRPAVPGPARQRAAHGPPRRPDRRHHAAGDPGPRLRPAPHDGHDGGRPRPSARLLVPDPYRARQPARPVSLRRVARPAGRPDAAAGRERAANRRAGNVCAAAPGPSALARSPAVLSRFPARGAAVQSGQLQRCVPGASRAFARIRPERDTAALCGIQCRRGVARLCGGPSFRPDRAQAAHHHGLPGLRAGLSWLRPGPHESDGLGLVPALRRLLYADPGRAARLCRRPFRPCAARHADRGLSYPRRPRAAARQSPRGLPVRSRACAAVLRRRGDRRAQRTAPPVSERAVMKIVVTGATGFIGRPLCMAFLEADHAVTVLSRDANKARGKLGIKVRSLTWGADASEEWKQAVAEADVVVHLAGEGVGARRWTPEFKETLRASRVETTRALVEAMRGSKNQPGALISASAVGYYGDRGDETLTEESPPGSDFLAELGTAWEAEAQKAEAFGARVARMRLGIVLGGGGALERMLYPFPALPFSPWKLGLGGPLGSGRQWMSWVHLADAVGMFFWAATNARVQG